MQDNAIASSPAPFLARIAAMVYELLLVTAVLFVASLPFLYLVGNAESGWRHFVFQAYLIGVLFAYFSAFWMRSGQTLAMKTWRIRLVRLDGGTLTLKQAALRFVIALFGRRFLVGPVRPRRAVPARSACRHPPGAGTPQGLRPWTGARICGPACWPSGRTACMHSMPPPTNWPGRCCTTYRYGHPTIRRTGHVRWPQQARHLISQVRLYTAPRILIAAQPGCALDEAGFRALGFMHSSAEPTEGLHFYYYDLDTYKTVPDWLNARFWANPERWEP